MFTWICPQCGKEVPPHETECPHCAEKKAEAKAPAAESSPKTEAPQQPVSPAPVPPSSTPAQQETTYEVKDRQGMPGWAVALLVAFGLTAIGAAAYYFVLPSMNGRSPVQQASPFEEVPPEGTMSASTNRLSKFVEATGFRITEDAKKRIEVRFLIVNHSAADLGDLAGKVHIRSTQSEADSSPISSIDFKSSRLGPYDSVEFKAIMSTPLRAYELPDWQFLTADVEITSPSEIQ